MRPIEVRSIEVRRIWRCAAGVTFTVLMGAAVAAGSAALVLAPRWRGRLRDRTTGAWARGLSRILGLRARVEGPLPPRGTLLVANHVSYVDVFLLAGAVPCTFVARGDVAGWPVLGLICRAGGVLFVDRARRADAPRAARALTQALALGRTVVLFPEGTSSDGRAVLPFRSALLDGAARAGLEVRAVALTYQTPPPGPPGADAVAWTGDAEFAPHVWALFALPRIDGYLRFLPATAAHCDRKALAQQLWAMVDGELKNLRQELHADAER